MNSNTKLSKYVLTGSLLAFLAFVFCILHINQEVFYTAHSRSEFLYGDQFYDHLMSKPFGLMQYVGGWLTQFFYKPALGAGMLVVIWTLIYLVGIKAFRLQRCGTLLMLLPVACLLASVVDLGYWIYVSTIRGYWFSQSVAYLAMLLLLWAARCTPRRYHLAWYLLGFCLYPVLGWYALLFVLCLALSEKPSWSELAGVGLVIFTAHIWRELLYSDQNLYDVSMAGLPRFENASDSTPYLTVPFLVLAGVTLLLPLCARYLDKWFVAALSTIASGVFVWSFMFYDSNYIDEMRMVRYAEADNWDEVLKIAEGNEEPTISIVMLKNIALMNKGGLLDRSFEIGNVDVAITNPDSLHVSFLEIAAPVAYYDYGMMNEAIRLNFENAIQSGFSPIYLKMLARCAYACGDAKLLKRYLALLHRHPFYRNWKPAPVSDIVNQLSYSYPDELTGVENSDSYIINSISLWYGANNKVAAEQALFFSMIRCDSRRFWASLRKYVKMLQPTDVIPQHVQEAYIMYMDKAPEQKRIMIPVSQEVYDRYNRFWEAIETNIKEGLDKADTKEKMRKEFGGTYWYYNIFRRVVY